MNVAEGYQSHRDQCDAQAAAVEPSQGFRNFGFAAGLIFFAEVVRVGIGGVVGEHELRECGSRQDVAHYEGEVRGDPYTGGYPVAPDRVDVDMVGVDFEVDPIYGQY